MYLDNPQLFETDTSPQGLFKASRAKLAKIDAALAVWTQSNGNASPKDRAFMLLNVVHQCSKWLGHKAKKVIKNRKGEKLVIRRQTAIRRLQQEALGRLNSNQLGRGLQNRLKTFEDRKKVGKHGNLRGLSQGYQQERESYMKRTKTQLPYSGSTAHESFEQLKNGTETFDLTPEQIGFVLDTGMPNMPVDSFEFLASKGYIPYTAYMDKIHRLKHMAIVDPADGLFYDVHDNGISFTEIGFGGYTLEPYAMDRYGNLFTKKIKGGKTKTTVNWGEVIQGSMNHSTFNSGNDVVCAGMVHIGGSDPNTPGKINHIDNNSGHYKPTRAHLWQCVRILAEQGADLQNTRVQVCDYTSGQLQLFNYHALTFLRDWNAAPDWTEQDGINVLKTNQ